MRPHWVLLFPMLLVAASRPLAQAPMPELRFTDPPGFYRSAIYPPADYSSQEVNASLQVYPFASSTATFDRPSPGRCCGN